MNRRDALKCTVGATVAAAMRPALGLILRGGVANTSQTSNYLGINSEGLTYGTIEQPWIDVLRCLGPGYGNDGLNGPWLTTAGTGDTNEEAYLYPTLDSDGWPTTLTISGIPGGQMFTSLQAYVFGQSGSLPPGSTQLFPYGTYQTEIVGSGSIQFINATSVTVLSGSTYLSVSGTTVTSTLPSGQNGTVSFVVGSSGLVLNYKTTSAAPNNLKLLYIVFQSNLAAYNSGEILSPDYKAAMTANGSAKIFACRRSMGEQNTYNQEFTVTFSANLAINATSGTLASIARQSKSYTTWPFSTGVTKRAVFATGQVVNMTGTYGSASVTWDTALSATISTSAVGAMAVLSLTSGWSQRTLPSNASWCYGNGIPYEVAIQACNELGIDPWINIAAALPTVDSTYLSSLAMLIYNGTGASLINWNVKSFAGLSSARRCYVESSNEVWNYGSGYREAYFCEMMGAAAGFYAARGNNGPEGAAEFQGVQTAGIGDAFYTVFGATMSSRVGVVVMQQSGVGSGSNFLQLAMNTPDWTSAAYTHHIYGYGCAPYFGPAYNAGGGALSSTDATTIAALADPVGELFSLPYTNVGKSGNTYSSLPTSGYLGWTLSMVASYIASFSSYAWKSLPFLCYEGGLDLGTYSATALSADLTAMITDSRARYLNNDPTHQLSSGGVGFLPGLEANGVTFVNMLNLCGVEWGQLELITQMESMPPYTNAPRYLGDVNYAQNLA